MLPLNRSRNRSRFFGLAVPQSALDLDFLSGTLDPRITFTRASSGTFFGSNGLLQTAANDVPRFDYDPSTLAPRGLLIEEQRTNLLLYNRDLTDITWVKTNITAVRNQTGIDGAANTATRLTASASNGTVLQIIISASAARATSVYMRRVTGTGAVEMTQDNGGTWTAIAVPTTWGRVTIPSATVTNPTVGFRIVTSGDAIDVDYCQCENGQFATSAIANTTTTTTRVADTAVMTGTNFSSWYNASEGTLFAQANLISSNYTSGVLVDVGAGGAFGTTEYIAWSGSAWLLAPNFTPINVTSSVTTSPTAKVAAGVKVNDSVISANGLVGVTDTNCNIASAPTNLHIGRAGWAAGNYFNGWIQRIVYWPVRVPNSQLQFITA